jgi:hydroxyacylglutathione hydrolase
MLKLHLMSLGPLQTNCYLAGCDETRDAALIDPAWDGRGIAAVAAEQGWTITHILLTHAHFDHVGGLAQLKEETGAPVYIHTDAVEPLRQAGMAAALWGIQMPATPPPDVMIAEGDIITVGRLNFHVLFTPGHAPGHVSFYLPDYGALFDGDVLFEQGIGRTDLPGGDYAVLMQSIREKILTLPDETDVFPGHGAPTIVGEEREWNPFLD